MGILGSQNSEQVNTKCTAESNVASCRPFVLSSLQLYVDSAERVSIEYEGYAVSSSAEV